jgi:recombination protein RecA
MAKKGTATLTKDEEVSTRSSKKDRFGDDFVANKIFEKYGDVIKRGTEVLTNIRTLTVLSVSPLLDELLGGGLREGTVVGLAGQPKCGKTTSMLHFVAKCQRLHPEKRVIYLNTEGRLNSQNFEGIRGLDPEKMTIIESSDKRKLSGEDFLTIATQYITLEPGCIIIIDSLSSLVPEDELKGELNASTRNKLPRLLSQFFKKQGGNVTNNKILLICIAHQIADTSPSQRARMTDCGNMFQYQVGTNIEITHSTRWKYDEAESKPDVGQRIHWKVLTSNLGGIPNSKTEGWLRYGIGIDEAKEVYEVAKQLALIKVAGSWYTLKVLSQNPDAPVVKKFLEEKGVTARDEDSLDKPFKFQGENKVEAFLDEHPEFVEFINEKIKEFS